MKKTFIHGNGTPALRSEEGPPNYDSGVLPRSTAALQTSLAYCLGIYISPKRR
jgi:hypothetical protein